MEIPTYQIQQLLRDRGERERAQPADQQLAHPVESEQPLDLLARIGINLTDLSGEEGGRFGL